MRGGPNIRDMAYSEFVGRNVRTIHYKEGKFKEGIFHLQGEEAGLYGSTKNH